MPKTFCTFFVDLTGQRWQSCPSEKERSEKNEGESVNRA